MAKRTIESKVYDGVQKFWVYGSFIFFMITISMYVKSGVNIISIMGVLFSVGWMVLTYIGAKEMGVLKLK